MKKNFKELFKEILNIEDTLYLDYDNSPAKLERKNLNFYGVRGSVRLLLRRFLTPTEIEDKRKNILSELIS